MTTNDSQIHHRKTDVSGAEVLYRQAGDPEPGAIVLLPGHPSGAHAYDGLTPSDEDAEWIVGHAADAYHRIDVVRVPATWKCGARASSSSRPTAPLEKQTGSLSRSSSDSHANRRDSSGSACQLASNVVLPEPAVAETTTSRACVASRTLATSDRRVARCGRGTGMWSLVATTNRSPDIASGIRTARRTAATAHSRNRTRPGS